MTHNPKPDATINYHEEYQRRLHEAVGELASGALLKLDSEGDWILVRPMKQPEGDVISQLLHRGWLEGMANGGTCKISDAGLKAYLRSMDELGDGQLIAPHEWRQS